MKLWSFLIFSVVLTAFIYPMEGYWTWGGGFYQKLRFQWLLLVFGYRTLWLVRQQPCRCASTGCSWGKYGKNGEIYYDSWFKYAALATPGIYPLVWLVRFRLLVSSTTMVSPDFENATAVGQIFLNINAAAKTRGRYRERRQGRAANNLR